MNNFSIRGAFGFAWELFKKRPWIFIGALVITGIANGLVSSLADNLEKGSLDGVGFLISMIASTLIGLGTTAFLLKAHDAVESVEIKDLWHPQLFWKYLGTTIIYGLGMLVTMIPFGIALFIRLGMSFDTTQGALGVLSYLDAPVAVALLFSVIAAIYVSTMLMFGTYAVVDRKLGPVEAMKESVRMTRGSRFHLIGFILVAAFVNILGLLALIVGLLVTIPLTMISFAHIYRTLSRAPATAVEA